MSPPPISRVLAPDKHGVTGFSPIAARYSPIPYDSSKTSLGSTTGAVTTTAAETLLANSPSISSSNSSGSDRNKVNNTADLSFQSTASHSKTLNEMAAAVVSSDV